MACVLQARSGRVALPRVNVVLARAAFLGAVDRMAVRRAFCRRSVAAMFVDDDVVVVMECNVVAELKVEFESFIHPTSCSLSVRLYGSLRCDVPICYEIALARILKYLKSGVRAAYSSSPIYGTSTGLSFYCNGLGINWRKYMVRDTLPLNL